MVLRIATPDIYSINIQNISEDIYIDISIFNFRVKDSETSKVSSIHLNNFKSGILKISPHIRYTSCYIKIICLSSVSSTPIIFIVANSVFLSLMLIKEILYISTTPENNARYINILSINLELFILS